MWQVVVDKRVVKQISKLPKGVVGILDQLRLDLVEEGPMLYGWHVKLLQGNRKVYSVKLKREYRALYEVVEPAIMIISVAHRKEVYKNVP